MAVLLDEDKSRITVLLRILKILKMGVNTACLRDRIAYWVERFDDSANELIQDMVKAMNLVVLAQATEWVPQEDPEYNESLGNLIRDAESALAAE